jgi:energy-coupling factor transport system ATP-binding protein
LENAAIAPGRLNGLLAADAPPAAVDRNRPPVVEMARLGCRLQERTVLEEVSFRLHPGECVALVGANGAGKTTLLRHLIGLQRAQEGVIRIAGRDIRTVPINQLARQVGLAFQNPDNQFFRFSVEEEIGVGPRALGVLDAEWIEVLMERFHLGAFRRRAPYRLSGGEKKRLAFASALAARPAVLALDEPTAGQDFQFRRELRAFLGRMQSQGQAIVIVTHDLTFAERAAPRWLLLAGGRLLADGAPDRIMADTELMARAGLEATDRFRLSRLGQRGRGTHV